ncbi:MAG: efflux RND transporter periplasmic adaptor subunit, partial [Chthoniobacteraceae bacterium]
KNPMKKILILAVIAALVGVTWFAKTRDWFGIFQPEVAVADDAPTAVAEKKDIDFSIQISGDVMPDTQLDVKAEVGGRIKVLHVQPGDRVKAGQVLVEIDDTDILSAQATAKTEIDGATLAVTKSDRNFERAKDLFEGKLISQEAFDNLSSELDIARNLLVKAERQMQVVRDQLSKTKVLAPGDGTVLTVPVVEGQVAIAAASVNSGTTLMSIANLSKLIVETHVNQVDVSKLVLKQRVKLMAEALKDEEMRAELSFIAPVATIRNGIKGFTVRATISQPTARMRPGMTVQMTIPIAHAEDVVTVPVSAVFKGNGNSRVVYVRKGMKTEKRTVKIGISNTEHAQILHGLIVGEEILLNEPERGQKRG